MSETKFLSTLKNSVLDEPEICFADFSVHAQEPPDAVNDSTIPPSCGWWFLTKFKYLPNIYTIGGATQGGDAFRCSNLRGFERDFTWALAPFFGNVYTNNPYSN